MPDLDAGTRTATVYVTNTGEQAISGGGVRVVFSYSDGSQKNSDTGFDLLPGVGFENTFVVADPATHFGALQPGQTCRISQVGRRAAQGVVVVRATAEVRALVFIDNAAVGDAQCIDEISGLSRERFRRLQPLPRLSVAIKPTGFSR
jgi:hypothetical protein